MYCARCMGAPRTSAEAGGKGRAEPCSAPSPTELASQPPPPPTFPTAGPFLQARTPQSPSPRASPPPGPQCRHQESAPTQPALLPFRGLKRPTGSSGGGVHCFHSVLLPPPALWGLYHSLGLELKPDEDGEGEEPPPPHMSACIATAHPQPKPCHGSAVSCRWQLARLSLRGPSLEKPPPPEQEGWEG